MVYLENMCLMSIKKEQKRYNKHHLALFWKLHLKHWQKRWNPAVFVLPAINIISPSLASQIEKAKWAVVCPMPDPTLWLNLFFLCRWWRSWVTICKGTKWRIHARGDKRSVITQNASVAASSVLRHDLNVAVKVQSFQLQWRRIALICLAFLVLLHAK